MQPPNERIRITLADSIPDTPGIYILAYMGKIVYIGLTQDSVYHALLYHQYKQDRLGQWMSEQDPASVRLDILIPPSLGWMIPARRALKQYFHPVISA